MIDVQWRDSVRKAYNLPSNTSVERIERATLQPKPLFKARKAWLCVRHKAD